VAHHLRTYHDGHYMVLNVSEESYGYACFEQQVLEFKFPGHPAPPLGMLFKMCASIESWLEADPENVVAVHCLTGRGRTSVVMACAMAWLGLFETPFEALAHVARRRGEII
ncbi:protein-tyrosine phosphatase-like protein, partial [Pelagophyceae sp. CCMP2097]